jgi:hypothetical protein
MQHDISDILFSLFKKKFNVKGSVNQEFNFIDKIKKKKHFLLQILIKFTFSVSVQSHD